MRTVAAGRPGIRAIHRAEVVPPAGEPSICIGFETDPGVDERALLEEAAAAVRAAGHEGVLLAPLAEGGALARVLRGRASAEAP